MIQKRIFILLSAIFLVQTHGHAQTILDEKVRTLFKHVDYESSWSRDGSQITFISNRNGFFNLYTVDSTGKQLRQLTSGNSNDDMPVFSPTANQIAFVSDMDGNNEIYTINSDGTNLKRITHDPADDIHPHWSPDGNKLIFNSSKNSKDINNPDRYDIFVRFIPTGKVEQLTTGGINTYGSFSPGGSEVVYRRSVGDKSQVMIMKLADRSVEAVTDGNSFDGWPSWGNDDSEIFFASDRSGSFQIYRIHIPTKKVESLTTMPGRFTNPRLSPDGKKLMFTGRRSGDQNTGIFFKLIR